MTVLFLISSGWQERAAVNFENEGRRMGIENKCNTKEWTLMYLKLWFILIERGKKQLSLWKHRLSKFPIVNTYFKPTFPLSHMQIQYHLVRSSLDETFYLWHLLLHQVMCLTNWFQFLWHANRIYLYFALT